MLTWIFTIMTMVVFGRLIAFAIRAAWGVAKVVFTLVFLPVVLLVMAFSGLLVIAFPLLAVIGLISLVSSPRIRC